MKTQDFSEQYNKVLHWFFSFPSAPVSLSELAEKLKIAKKTASNIVSIMIKERFLTKEEIGKSWRISCNIRHRYNYTRKISYNLELIYSLLYKQGLLEKIHKITGQPKAIVLFGSYRKGDDNEKSDLDLAVEIAGSSELKITALGNQEVGYRKDVPINLHIFSRSKIDLNLFNNVANGIVLEGFLEVKK